MTNNIENAIKAAQEYIDYETTWGYKVDSAETRNTRFGEMIIIKVNGQEYYLTKNNVLAPYYGFLCDI